eukprot:CAMPEP_0196583526 /NCGR_PEP_ID=MMETSP1081-20130531/43884_1 /TAXON_ID=36882 /ORGANISM="Pyramimonas amylifera, Strain CCMP720" /LENGTH=531 /DNA_ID=CAMNT_0041904447 /DNA_START=65 /DNA_END=1660 /DNA_ORIENTATION=-
MLPSGAFNWYQPFQHTLSCRPTVTPLTNSTSSSTLTSSSQPLAKSLNTTFLNSLQLDTSKYAPTQTRCRRHTRLGSSLTSSGPSKGPWSPQNSPIFHNPRLVKTWQRKVVVAALSTSAFVAATSPPNKSESSLTVKELKQLLDEGGVDYQDCFEKSELVARLKTAKDTLSPKLQNRIMALLSSQSALAKTEDSTASSSSTSSALDQLFMDEQNTVGLFKRCAPSVVHITTTTGIAGPLFLNIEEIPRGSGSGFIWDTKGHIVTNFHVIQGARRAKIALNDGRSFNATLVGQYPDSDIAVLKITLSKEEEPLQPISVGNSGALQVGQKCFAIGNPFGLDQTLTSGIISGLGRDMKAITGRTIRGVVQTDAAINPGNSGGPLLNSQGALVGVNTMIYSTSGASSGVGFAVPSDSVRRIVNQLIRDKKVTRPALGVVCATNFQTRQLKLKGALILNVAQGGPASQASLRPTTRAASGQVKLGDLIIGVGPQKVNSVEDLVAAVEECEVGEEVTVKVMRNNKPLDVKVKLQARKE